MSTLPPVLARQRLPLTPSQTEIWLDQCVHPKSTAFIISLRYAITRAVEVERFLRAANWVFSHHDALYSRLSRGADGLPEIVMDPSFAPVCEYVDLSQEDTPHEAMLKMTSQRAQKPFEMIDACLSHHALYKTSAETFCYHVSFHHIMVDGWGSGIVFTRIAEAYERLAQGQELGEGKGSFAEYIQNYKKTSDTAEHGKDIEFWTPLLKAPVAPLAPPHASGQKEREHDVSDVYITLPRELADKLTIQAAASKATLFHVLLLAYSYLLETQYGNDTSSVSMPILNRGKDHKETIGHLTELRTTPLPVKEEQSVEENLHAIARRIRDVFRHYHLPVAELTRLYQEQGNSGLPISHTSLSYITRDFSAKIDGVPIEMQNVPAIHSRAPFTLYVFDIYPGKDIRLELMFQRQHMNDQEAGFFVKRLVGLLARFAEDPKQPLSQIDLLPDEERAHIASILDREEIPAFSGRPVIFDILDRAHKAPDVIAVEEDDLFFSYKDRVAKATGIARALLETYAIQPGDNVALLLPRGGDLIASQLACMLAGCAFVPIEVSSPEIRARQIAADSDAKCVITNATSSAKARSLGVPVLVADDVISDLRPFAPLATQDQVAYIIYTSGSTGRPKGVEISHQALAEHCRSWLETVPQTATHEKWLHFHSPAFDASIESIFLCMILGHTLVAAPHPQWTVFDLPKVILERKLNVLFLAPDYLHEFLRHMKDNARLLEGNQVRLCLSGGSAMYADVPALWHAAFGPDVHLFNIYGPTECTVTSNALKVPLGYHAETGESVAIGSPHKGRIQRIVDKHDRDTPLGVEGELLIGGIGLANGYHNMSEETAARFVTLEKGRRYYRSGDIVKLKSDGNIIFRQRMDRQVKIRGFRIELGEIETSLLTNPAIKECAVITDRDKNDALELKAFVALESNSTENTHSLRDYLLARLPHYMIPTLVMVEKLPRGISGKVDNLALRSLVVASEKHQSGSPSPAAPSGPVQEYLAILWEQTLGEKVLDAKADFFEMGGHSLLAAGLITKISKAFRVEYPFASFFESPSLKAIESKLEQLVGDRACLHKMANVRLELARLSPDEIKAKLANMTKTNA